MGGGFVLPSLRAVATLGQVRARISFALPFCCVAPGTGRAEGKNPMVPRILPVLLTGLTLAALTLAGPSGALAQDDPAPAGTDSMAVPAPEPAAEASDSVGRAAVCTGVVDREPVGEATSFSSDAGQLYCFTEIRGLKGTTITHAWIHDGTTRARVQLPVRSDQWRTWSTKTVLPGWTGAWQVKILDADGIVLKTLDFKVE